MDANGKNNINFRLSRVFRLVLSTSHYGPSVSQMHLVAFKIENKIFVYIYLSLQDLQVFHFNTNIKTLYVHLLQYTDSSMN